MGHALKEKDSSRLLCLRLVRGALETCGGEAACRIRPLLSLVRDDLSHSLLWIGQGGRGEVGWSVSYLAGQ